MVVRVSDKITSEYIAIISMTTDKTSSKTQPPADLMRVNKNNYIIKFNRIHWHFYTCGREAVNLVSSVHAYTEPMYIFPVVVFMNLLHPTTKAQQK